MRWRAFSRLNFKLTLHTFQHLSKREFYYYGPLLFISFTPQNPPGQLALYNTCMEFGLCFFFYLEYLIFNELVLIKYQVSALIGVTKLGTDETTL